MEGKLRSVEYLVDKGADVDLKNERGETALRLALQHERFEVAKLLLK